MEDEKWLPVVGYEGLYEVSDFGRVRSLDALKFTGPGRSAVYTLPGRVLKPRWDTHGYAYVDLSSHPDSDGYRKRSRAQVHRLVAIAHIRPPNPTETDVNHLDGRPFNNLRGNLEWTTHKQNMEHASDLGLLCGGSASGRTKLTAEVVAKIVEMGRDRRLAQHEIAAAFGVKQQAVSKVLSGASRNFGAARGVPIAAPGTRARTARNSVLTESHVRSIRSLAREMSQAEIARMFSVSKNNVNSIIRGLTWRDII